MVEETTFEQLKKGLLELLRGYPSYIFFGKIESYLKESKSSLKVLENDGIIEFASKRESNELNKKLTQEHWNMLRAEGKKEPLWYRLASKGVDLAISMVNQDNANKVLFYAEETHKFNRWIRWLTIGLFIIGLSQLILMYLQNSIF